MEKVNMKRVTRIYDCNICGLYLARVVPREKGMPEEMSQVSRWIAGKSEKHFEIHTSS